jgi:hypothetical protein
LKLNEALLASERLVSYWTLGGQRDFPGTAPRGTIGPAMDAAIVIALIALAGSIISTLATVIGAPALQKRREAKDVLERHREPLVAAAYELQARLHNILCNRFVDDYVLGAKAGKQEAALESTLYVFAQFFGWREIIRREIRFLRFPKDEETREVGRLLRDIGEAFLTDDYGPQFMIWRVEQRGLGERMIVTVDGKATCMGYATFIEARATMSEWLDPLERDLRQMDQNGRTRLTVLQHLLLELVRKLDEDQTRYPFKLEKASDTEQVRNA